MAKAKKVKRAAGDDDAGPKKKKAKKPRPVPQEHPGADEAAEWLAARGLDTRGKIRWNVRVVLADDADDKPTTFQLDVYRDEWGVRFVHEGKTSHVRRVHTTFASGGDPHELVKELPALAAVGALVRGLEARHGIAFDREHALVQSNLAGASAKLAPWIAKL